jgi:hypothetical protein
MLYLPYAAVLALLLVLLQAVDDDGLASSGWHDTPFSHS